MAEQIEVVEVPEGCECAWEDISSFDREGPQYARVEAYQGCPVHQGADDADPS